MEHTTSTNIIEFLESITDATPATLRTKTRVKLLKKDKDGNKNTLGDVWRIKDTKVTLGKTYAVAVNERRAAEHKATDFVPQDRKWGVRDGVFIKRGDELYVQAIVDDDSRVATYVVDDGTQIEQEVFAPFVSAASSQTSLQGVEEVVRTRTYKLESILAVIVD